MKNVLIIDASYLMLLVYKSFFAGSGYSLAEVFSYKEAVDFLEKKDIDLIMLDIDFFDSRNRSGKDIYRYLREEKHVKTPMIVFFGEWLHERNLSMRNSPNEIWLRKPVDLIKMKKGVEKLLGVRIKIDMDKRGPKEKGDLCWTI